MDEIYEKLGLFYLGKDVDSSSMDVTEALTLLKNKNFTTHAAIIGMTGSGKTGLGIGLMEEAAIDNIPSIIIDPKGDMGNLCLSDPTFSADIFEPWVRDEANLKNEEPKAYAGKIAQEWKEGLESWDQDASRVEKFHKVEKTIYTPGSSAGIPINVISSLDVPPHEVMNESDTFSSYLKSTVTSLLSFIGINGDPLESKEYILLAQILSKAWVAHESMSIATIIGKIISPSFDKIGVLPLEDFYPKEKRFVFATKFNGLLASPNFSQWLEGDELDIQRLLYDEEGRAKIAIFSISHLNDDERMFFVTLLLNKYIAWMRRQSGTSALKALLYMDEIFGYFPPSKNPPSKEPMLILLKQARAFGLGVVLSTQNPVDLDYKALSNIGTWFIGRLQTKQDIDKVVDGLEGKVGSSLSKEEIKKLLANLKKRTFFLKSAHLDDIRLFTTRWVLSYLKGPLKKAEISSFMQDKKAKFKQDEDVANMESPAEEEKAYQDIDDSISQYYEMDVSEGYRYKATLGAKVKVHFYQARRGIDTEEELILSLPLNAGQKYVNWANVVQETEDFTRYMHTVPPKATFSPLPEAVLEDKALNKAIRELKETLYRTRELVLFRSVSLKLESKVGESHSDFMVRVQDSLTQKKEIELDKLQERYGKREKTLQTRLLRAKERVEKESSDSTSSMIDTGIAVLGALFGKPTPTKIGRALSKGKRVLKERGDISRAEERVVEVEDDIEALRYEVEDKMDVLSEKYSIENYEIERFALKPRKTDIDVEVCAVVWRV